MIQKGRQHLQAMNNSRNNSNDSTESFPPTAAAAAALPACCDQPARSSTIQKSAYSICLGIA
jgi:hypothetical protein